MDPGKEHFCGHCGALATFECSRCQSVAYCSAAHQNEAWKKHKASCKPPAPSPAVASAPVVERAAPRAPRPPPNAALGAALQRAIVSRDSAEAIRLIRAGADVRVKDDSDEEALAVACRHSLSDVALAILKEVPEANADARNGSDRTALIWTCIQGLDDVCDALFARGVDVNRLHGSRSPLGWACAYARKGVALKLIEDARADVNAGRETALSLAEGKGEPLAAVKAALLKAGAK